MDALLDLYKARFREQFPLMLCRGMTEEAICQIIQKCLDDAQPYDPKLDSDANY